MKFQVFFVIVPTGMRQTNRVLENQKMLGESISSSHYAATRTHPPQVAHGLLSCSFFPNFSAAGNAGAHFDSVNWQNSAKETWSDTLNSLMQTTVHWGACC
jgi:hypothetical protein